MDTYVRTALHTRTLVCPARCHHFNAVICAPSLRRRPSTNGAETAKIDPSLFGVPAKSFSHRHHLRIVVNARRSRRIGYQLSGALPFEVRAHLVRDARLNARVRQDDSSHLLVVNEWRRGKDDAQNTLTTHFRFSVFIIRNEIWPLQCLRVNQEGIWSS